MEQIEPIETTESAKLPVMEPRWDPEKAGKRKVRLIKVPHGQDPMREKTIFEFGGFVYICYAVKTRARYMIRCLGMADVEKPATPDLTPYEAGKLLDDATDDMGEDIMEEAGKEAEGHGQSSGPDQTPDS